MKDNNKRLLSQIFYTALKAVDPYKLVRSYKETFFSDYYTDNCKRLFVIGSGKAACQMGKAVEDFAMDIIEDGIVITKYGHCHPPYRPKKIGVNEAGHPVPDENGVVATQKIMNLIRGLDKESLLLCLISGGGSALLVSPFKGILLNEKQKVTELLLKAGASIEELNTVRKHISNVKGGRLAKLAYPTKIISLIISDVIGDRFDTIASGPTSPDLTTYHDAYKVIKNYGLIELIPRSVLVHIQKGIQGLIHDTPKMGDRVFSHVENIIIGSNKKALEAARAEAEKLFYHVDIVTSEISGEARDIGTWLADKAKELKRTNRSICFISGGETTVTVKGNGTGGRNMELALSFAIKIEGIDGITLLSAGTDGTDGPTDAAGAIVDRATITRAKARGLNPENYLENNDSYTFFKETGDLFITGPTGTNVMDIQIVVIK
jgi:glycerate-2-kinase